MTEPSPTAHRRRMVMAEAVMHHGSMRVGELAELTGVSTMTVYRDLVALEEAGVVQRDRGRVIAQACGLHEADAVFRLDQHRQDKQEMAARAAELIPPGSSLMLDDSTSSIRLLRAMLTSSQVRIPLIDRSKLRRQALVRFADLTDFDHVVVDSRISPEDAESLRQRGVEPIIAPPLPAGRPPAQPSPPAGTTTAEDGGAGG